MLSALYRVVSVIIFNINITHFLIDNVAVICLQQTCALNNFRNSRYVEKKCENNWTWAQCNKTFTSVIYKCSYCFRG